MKIAKIALQHKMTQQIYEFKQYDPKDIMLQDENHETICTLAEFLEKADEELKIVDKINRDKNKLEPSGAV